MATDTAQLRLLPGKVAVATYVLTDFEMYDWGAFAGRHHVPLNPAGTAIIGATGSGKSTFVDALMTLIAATPRYNLASTGGHDSDRDLVSYVRGVSGPGNNSGDNRHIARSGKTVSAIAARFSNGEAPLTIAALFSFDGTSSALADLKRLWIYSQAVDQSLDHWLQIYHDGGARALKALGRETTGLHVHDTKGPYLAQVKRFFEVGDNAFALVNRATGLKQLDSIDEIFRELVLEDRSAFDRAAEVAKEFDDLAAIHAELEIARTQQLSLLPVASGWQLRTQLQDRLIVEQEIRTILPVWYAEEAHRLWSLRLQDIDAALETSDAQARELAQEIRLQEAHADSLRLVYLQLGGSTVEQLLELIASHQRIITTRTRNANEYRRVAIRFALDGSLDAETVAHTQKAARELQALHAETSQQLRQTAWDHGAARQGRQQELKALKDELQQVKSRPGSSVPGEYQRFRTELGEFLNLDEEALPYVAELIEVKPTEQAWRGAIERVLGGERLRILVPSAAIAQALGWINGRHNRLHVRLLEVQPPHDPVEFFADSFARKLQFKVHQYREAVKAFLAGLDRHCVASTEVLHRVPFAVTLEGTMSGKSGRFDKQDQRPLEANWMTGFDNNARLADLARSLAAAETAFSEAQARSEAAQRRAEEAQQLLALLQSLIEVSFSDIDLPGAEREAQALDTRLAALNQPESDAQKAHEAWADADRLLRAHRSREQSLLQRQAVLDSQRDTARGAKVKAFRRVDQGLNARQRELAAQHLGGGAPVSIDTVDDVERQAGERLMEAIQRSEKQLSEVDKDLVRGMEKAKKVDTGALTETGTEIIDVPAYLERLRQLTEEALPEKMQRFITYLNQSSDQGVTQLLSDIDNEVSMIEERIEDLNRTLRRVDFQPACYLRLQPQRVVHESLRELQQAQRQLRSAELKDDQGESHFRALGHMVTLLRGASERKKTIGARELLDPRYRLQFSVSMIERDTGDIVETRTGSQGGSGGEKEIIANYVLTASLSYALCPPGSDRPLFGTIVLDEAFSRTSHAFASRIINALEEFGLHPLFVTPNKELRLLREHTRSAILMHKKGQRATTTCLSWEELERYAHDRTVTVDK
jgi:uncharacterized protein YPO0396